MKNLGKNDRFPSTFWKIPCENCQKLAVAKKSFEIWYHTYRYHANKLALSRTPSPQAIRTFRSFAPENREFLSSKSTYASHSSITKYQGQNHISPETPSVSVLRARARSHFSRSQFSKSQFACLSTMSRAPSRAELAS